ncbi:DUF3857 domain-containing protein [Solilutibacter silvestris]|uniref:DUF3857 domain-containing protein n=1 Tax=Solilutibacter silvestris TaxID=1645665 RepID=A0A2K1PX50_9GAMM|nr:DUF3857 domain-containing protein [Lysobacter silvestris]PNS07368.1 hypothetical protein Lysil_1544 [Lysobacter silvestris]
MGMKTLWCALLLVCAGAAPAETFKRGEYEFTTGPVPAFVQLRGPLPDAWPASAPGGDEGNWRTWRYDEQVDHRASRNDDYFEYIYQPRTQSNLGQAGRYQIEFNPDYQHLVIHAVALRRNGKWEDRLRPATITVARRESEFEQDIANGTVEALIVLDDIRVDDLVRISYTVQGGNPVLAGQESESIYLGWNSPMLDSWLRVLYPPRSDVAIHSEHTKVQADYRELADGREMEFHQHGTPAIQNEDDYPVWYQPYPYVQASQRRSWGDVVAWALPLYPSDRQLPADLQARITQWKTLPDPDARLAAALRAVQDEVRYFGVETGQNSHRPNAPGVTWSRRYGDCKDKAYLLSMILRQLDIRAEPALVSTVRGKRIGEFSPSGAVFNHVIVRVDIGGQAVWVDPTASLQGGMPRDTDLSAYGMALPIRSGQQGLESIAAPVTNRLAVNTSEHFVIQPDGSARLDITTEYRGGAADDMRSSVNRQRLDDLKRNYAEYYQKRYGQLDVLAAPVISDDLPGNVLKVNESYRIVHAIGNEGALKALQIYGEALSQPLKLPKTMSRSGPLYFARQGTYRHETRVTAPATWVAAFGGDTDEQKTKAFDYTRSVKTSGQEAHVVYEVKIDDRYVAADQGVAHVEALRKVRDDLSSTLRYRVPLQGEAADRDRRLKALLDDVSGAKK